MLCDGDECDRAFHMGCLASGFPQPDIEDEQSKWKCPVCCDICNIPPPAEPPASMQTGDRVEVFDRSMKGWYLAEVKQRSKKSVRVHFCGYAPNWDFSPQSTFALPAEMEFIRKPQWLE